MKRLPFPYAIAAELFLFGPPGRKVTLFHLLIVVAMWGVGIAVYRGLATIIWPGFALLAAIPAGLLVLYPGTCLVILAKLVLWWSVEKIGLVQYPDEEKLARKIMRYAGWKDPESEKKDAPPEVHPLD